jgi:transposase
MSSSLPDRLIEVEAVVVPAARRAPAGASKTFRPYRPGQVLLMAPDAREWVPDGDLAHFVEDLVEEVLDLSAIYDSYVEERGFPPYDPRLMVKLLVYGYATGVTSSRKLETATHRDVAVRMLCAGQQPDYRAIARFRKRHLEALAALFVQSLRLCRRAGLVRLHALAVDGTKLRASASRHKAMSYDRMLKAEADLDAETQQLRAIAQRVLAEAAAVDAAEDQEFGPDSRGDELPPELRRREDRLKWIREAKAALEAEAEAAETARRQQMRAEGRAPRATPRDGRDPFAPKPRAQRNFTDPESRIMKTSDGSFHQCYNAQAIVDSTAQVIVAAELSNIGPDVGQLEGVLGDLVGNLAAIDAALSKDAVLLGDAGYFSAENVQTVIDRGLDPLLATGKFKHNEPPPIAPKGRIAKDATPKQRMARTLRTKAGHAAYARRKAIVEPAFGQMMTVLHARQLRLRGLVAARAQWRFDCAVHNLLKLHRNGGLAALPAR